MPGRLFGHALPPDVTVVGQGHVGKDAVLAAGFHGIGVGAVGGAGGNAEPAGFGIDRARGAVRTGLDPGNVIAHRGDFVAFERGGGDEHGKIGFAAGAGKGGGDVAFFPVRRFQSENEHVFGHPSLIASDNRSDAQGETLFAEQGVASVAAAVAHDEAFLGEMGDEGVLRIAGPRDVLHTFAQRAAHRVEAFHVEAIRAEHVENALSDAGHDAHVGHNVGRVGDFHPDARDLRADRAHAEGNDIHGASAHAAPVKAGQLFLHHGRVLPIVGRAGVVFRLTADEGALFDPGHVPRVGADEQAVGPLLLVEPDGRTGVHHDLPQASVFLLRAVAPDNVVRLTEFANLLDPREEILISGRRMAHAVYLRNVVLVLTLGNVNGKEDDAIRRPLGLPSGPK